MSDATGPLRTQLARQVARWCAAAAKLQRLDEMASPTAWNSLERYLGVSIRQHLAGVADRLGRQAEALRAAFAAALKPGELQGVWRQLLEFRKRYVRAETTLDFYADAVNTRTNPEVAALLRACDSLAHRSMAQILDQLGKPTPVVLTYVDKGLGASILKAGLRLWDGTSESPVAAVKLVRHSLPVPATSLIHETRHQVAHILDWNDELARAISQELAGAPAGLADVWAGWASEIAADAHAFVHTGFAGVAALHDVVAGDPAAVLRHIPGDPHPTSYVRVLLGTEFCRQFFKAGPWAEPGTVTLFREASGHLGIFRPPIRVVHR